MAYQPIPDNNYAAPLVVAIVPQQLVGPSFGITTTPNPGWDCCNLPPCVCCVRPIYFSDNHKTWGETGQIVFPCCGCSNWNVTNAKVSPAGMAYDFHYTKPCCDDGMIVVSRGGIEVGRLLTHTFCCPCDKTVINAIDTQGKSRWTLRVPPFSCCGDGCGCGRCKFVCCSGRPCCETWSRWDNLFLSGPEGTPLHPHHVRASLQYNNCCPNLYPKWFGYDAPPAATEDDRALLLGFLFLYNFYPHQFQFQIPQFSVVPPTLGAMLN